MGLAIGVKGNVVLGDPRSPKPPSYLYFNEIPVERFFIRSCSKENYSTVPR